jgi:hypothetical protein
MAGLGMNMKIAVCILLGTLLAGCQSTQTFVEDHPKAVGITAALIVGGLAASAGSSGKSREIGIPPNPCAGNPEACR